MLNVLFLNKAFTYICFTFYPAWATFAVLVNENANYFASSLNGNCGFPFSEACGVRMEPLAAASSFYQTNTEFRRL